MRRFHSLMMSFGLLVACTAPASASIELRILSLSQLDTPNATLTATIQLSGAADDAHYFIRGAFYQPSSSAYFGFTQNATGAWHNQPSDHTQYFEVIGNAVATINVRLDVSSPAYQGPGEYLFKVGRYTPAGSLTWSDNSISVIIPEEFALSSPSPSPPVPTAPPTTPTTAPSPTPTVLPISAIRLSEIFACAESGEFEWIELYNSLPHSVELKDWMIRDNSTSNKKLFSGNLSSKGLFVVETNSLLNNSGDQVRLYDAAGTQVDAMSYPSCQHQASWIREDSAWQHTSTPTKNSPNTYTPLATTPPTQSPASLQHAPLPSVTPSPHPLPSPSTTTQETSTSATSSATISGLVLGRTLDTLSQQTSTPSSGATAIDHPPDANIIGHLSLGIGMMLSAIAVLYGYRWYNSAYRS